MKIYHIMCGFTMALLLLPIRLAHAENPDLNTLIGDTAISAAAYTTTSGSDGTSGAASPGNLGIGTSVGDYGVKFGNKNAYVIAGRGICSTQRGSNNNGAWSKPTTFDTLTDETGQKGANYCYCNFTQYKKPSTESWRRLIGPYMYVYEAKDEGSCGETCAANCVSYLDKETAYRTAMFDAYAPAESSSTCTPDLSSIIGDAEPTVTACIDYTGHSSGCKGDPADYGVTYNSGFAVDFGKIGYITGLSRCSKTAGTSSGATVADLTDETGQNGAEYCWCNITTYGKTRMTGPWAYGGDTYSIGENCAVGCSGLCVKAMTMSSDFRYALFGATCGTDVGPLNTAIGNAAAFDGGATTAGGGWATTPPKNEYHIAGKPLAFAVNYAKDKTEVGIIRGRGRCSRTPGDNNNGTWINPTTFDTLADETGNEDANYCYCRLDDYSPDFKGLQTFKNKPLVGPWVYLDVDKPLVCASSCASWCASELSLAANNGKAIGDEVNPFRLAMFYEYGLLAPMTTQTYVDDTFNAKQAKITTTGTDKLMLYGANAGALLTRDIVTTLGSNAYATTVPAVGAVVTGLNTKQNALNGTNGWVATGTGTAGEFGEKPVYTPLVSNYTDALVPASTLNSVVTAAAESELSCTQYVSGAAETPANCLLWGIAGAPNLGIFTTCARTGTYCDASSDCCNSATCTNHTCAACRGASEECAVHSDCCPGFYCDTAKPRRCIACKNINTRCNSNEQCCSGLCENGICAFEKL